MDLTDLPEHEVLVMQVTMTHIVPANGWSAVFVDERDDGSMFIYAEPLALWGLQTFFDNHYSLSPVGSKVVGLIPSFGLESAEDLENFLGYAREGDDLEQFSEIAKETLKRIHEEEDGESNV